jgi:hypothetical protein
MILSYETQVSELENEKKYLAKRIKELEEEELKACEEKEKELKKKISRLE